MRRYCAAKRAPAVLAGVVLVLAAVHVSLDADRLAVKLAEASLLGVFAAALAFVALRVAREGYERERMSRIVTTSLAGGVVVGCLSAVYLGARLASDEPVTEGWLVVSIGWSLGTSGGAIVGYYVERIRSERAAQAELTGRLTVLQRVLRHNIRNEVTVISGIAANVIAATDDPALTANLRTLREHSERVSDLSKKVQTLANLWNEPETVTTDLAVQTRAEVDDFRDAHPAADVSVSASDRVLAAVHPGVEAAIREALDNAAIHNDVEDLSIEVRVERDGNWTVVDVVDDGSEIPEEDLAALSASRELPLQHVTGLGLWVIYWVVELSDGRLDIENRVPSGVRVRMRFPSAESGVESGIESEVESGVAPGVESA